MVSFNSNLQTTQRQQRTLQKPVSFSGIGIHTGHQVKMRFCPAPEGSGICFKRVDLPNQPVIPATLEYVCDTSLRSTTLGLNDIRIHTVEHVLAALRAYQIDNLVIELSDIEPPVGNGSSDVFVEMIQNAGIADQNQTLPIVKIQKPIYWSEKDIHLVALPYDGYKISYTLSYPNSKFIGSQYFSAEITSEIFTREIAPCRTFSLYEELSYLIDKGLVKGGSLDNAVIIKEDAVLSKGGLFFKDEMVRHKVLDMVGDFFLVGFEFKAHILAIKSGHASNHAFAKHLFNDITREMTQ